MKWTVLIAGVCGAPFTGGWSLLLGLVGFAFAAAGEHTTNRTRAKIRSSSPVGGVAVAVGGAVVILLLMGAFLSVAALIAAQMVVN